MRYFRGLNTEQFALCHEQSCQILFFLQLYCQKELNISPSLQQQVESSSFSFSLCWWFEQPLRHLLHPKLLGVDSAQVSDADFPYTGQPLPGSEFSLKV